MRAHPCSADGELLFAELLEIELRRHLFSRNREERIVHLRRDGAWKRTVDPCRPIHGDMAALGKRRDKERKTLDVIVVGVANEQVQAHRPGWCELECEFASSSPTVEHDERPVVGAYLNTRGVATVANRFRAWHRDGPARTPEFDSHGLFDPPRAALLE